jgi:hypothetical protein
MQEKKKTTLDKRSKKKNERNWRLTWSLHVFVYEHGMHN